MSLLHVLFPAERENHKTIWFYTTVSIPKLDEHFEYTLTSFRTYFFLGGTRKMQNENEPVKCPTMVQTDSLERAKWKEANESVEMEEDH